ncbi:hypothetical protein IT408_03630 [Candidatus Uhrbacteria bacterium]|nr:hypothetical protein [Candidatus Uhrbacteria bacterium]
MIFSPHTKTLYSIICVSACFLFLALFVPRSALAQFTKAECTKKSGTCLPHSECSSPRVEDGTCTDEPVNNVCCKVPLATLPCNGQCQLKTDACPSDFSKETNGVCPSNTQKCCEKSENTKKCTDAPGTGLCIEKSKECPAEKKNVNDAFSCSETNQKCCTSAAASTSTSAGAGSPSKLTDPLGGVGLYGIIRRVISTALGLVGAVALLVFFTAGVMYMIGGENYVTMAKAAMVNATIGLLVIFFAYSIAQWFFIALTS